MQRNSVFLAGYLYDEAGAAVWYTAQGDILGRSVEAELLEFENGQAIGAAYRQPSVRTARRTLTLEYETPDTLIVELDGLRTVILERFNF